MLRSAIAVVLLFISVILACPTVFAQTTSGRWAVGFTGGLNIWVNDVYGITPSGGGLVDAQYGISNSLSAGISVGFESLRSKSSDLRPGQPFPYMKLYAFPATIDFCLNLIPGEIISPFIKIGGGTWAYQLLGASGVGLPDREFRISYLARLGVGVQAYRSDAISVTGELGYVMMDDVLDRSKTGALDGYVFGKIGLKLHFGEILHLVETPMETVAPLPILVIR